MPKDPEPSASLPGIRVLALPRYFDDRGYFMELFRTDWKDFFGDDAIVQSNLSWTYPGVVRAWHRHRRGQVDYFVTLQGALKICAYDDEPGSPTRGGLFEKIVHAAGPTLVRVPGHYWHGVMAVGNEPAMLIYFVTRLYDRDHPDEERRPWNDPAILDPRTGKPYDWFRPPHR